MIEEYMYSVDSRHMSTNLQKLY